jgi:hypothetical protein
MLYLGTIKWIDNGNIQDDMIFKIGEVGEDDDDIFFYFEDEAEIEEFKEHGAHDWILLDIGKIID